METKIKAFALAAAAISFLSGCSAEVADSRRADVGPPIFPDYADVTIPPNIAPLNFRFDGGCRQAQAVFESGDAVVTVKAKKGGLFSIPRGKWRRLLQSAAASGGSILVTVHAKNDSQWVTYKTFKMSVAEDKIDPYLAYRLIEPGYESWGKMGIYQRCLETFEQTPVIENSSAGYGCMNCHSFCMQNPGKMLFHMRAKFPGTIIVNEGKIEKLNTKTEQTGSPLVYPSWHPSGKYVAFSVNDTRQVFHANNKNRIEVFDLSSDVVVYDVEKHEIMTAPALFSKAKFETFPTFSPDGKTLYFCSADTVPMPDKFDEARYSLCAIPFDPNTRTFGASVDTLYNARTEGCSVSFPRVSPDGKYLLYTLASYGNFSIWHKDADLQMLDLATKENACMDEANSADVESYHTWSSNSRWIIFSSRRTDGLYTRPYIAYIGDGGKPSKPFLLPQKDPELYHTLMKSFNIPELATGKVKPTPYALASHAKDDAGIDVTFSMQK